MLAVRCGANAEPLRVASRAIVRRSGGSVALCMGGLQAGGLDLRAVGEDALAEAREHLAGADLDEAGAPASSRASIVSRQRTGLVSAAASSARTSSNGLVEAQEKTGKRGSPIAVFASASRNGATAGSISGEWNAPATLSLSARRPWSRASSSASASASRAPESTTWPGALSLATVTPACAAISRASSSVAPTSASIEPVSSASAIRRPRRTTSSSASSRSSTPAAASAASSPSEWPAATPGSRPSASQPVRLAQKIAGWAKRVLSSTRGNGSSPTSSMTRSSRSGARRATWSRISGVWLPWPGNSTAGAWVSVTKLTQGTLRRVCATSVSSHVPTPRVGGWSGVGGGCPGRSSAVKRSATVARRSSCAAVRRTVRQPWVASTMSRSRSDSNARWWPW